MSTPDYTSFLNHLRQDRDRAAEVMGQSLPAENSENETERYLYKLIRGHLRDAGKGLRPFLCLATCRAFGGNDENALLSAAAIEMLHNAFLVHDDIEDGSKFRRNNATMYTQTGVPLALNAGDAMQAISMRLLRKNLTILNPQLALKIFDEFDHLQMETLEGQALELGWRHFKLYGISDNDYLRMTLKKTCWYSFIHPCRIGALIARPEDQDLDRFNFFGFCLGTAFQIQDDVLNLTGSQKKYGKEIGGDLYEGKRTLMLSHFFEHGSSRETQKLKEMLSRSDHGLLERHIDEMKELLHTHGSIEFARSCAVELRDAAEQAFEEAYKDAPEGEDKTFIRQCLQYMTDRTS